MRDFDSNLTAALAKNEVYLVLLAEFEFASGTQRFWAGPEGKSLAWDSKTWTSIADLGTIDKISQAQGLTDSRSIVSLRVNSDQVSEIGSDDSRGRAATIELLFLTENAAQIASLRFPKTMGELRVAASVAEEQSGRRVVNEEVRLELLDETSTLERRSYMNMTYEAGLRIDDEDHGLEFVADPTAIDLGIVADNRVSGNLPYGSGSGSRDNF